MKDNYTRVRLPARRFAELKVWAERGFLKPSELAQKVIEAWLKEGDRSILKGHLSCDLNDYCQANQRIIALREKIVLEWRELRIQAKHRGRTMNSVTTAFLERIANRDGVKINFQTLYIWHKHYASKGPMGLMDRRRNPISARQASRAALCGARHNKTS